MAFSWFSASAPAGAVPAGMLSHMMGGGGGPRNSSKQAMKYLAQIGASLCIHTRLGVFAGPFSSQRNALQTLIACVDLRMQREQRPLCLACC